MRTRIVAGNWKMNLTLNEGKALVEGLLNDLSGKVASSTKVVFCTPFIQLTQTVELTKNHPQFFVAAQNCHTENSGAYTGEISVPMIKDAGATFVVIGHSERREYFNEDNQLLAKKTDKVLEFGLTPIFCCGETRELRENGDFIGFVKNQLTESLFHLSAEEMKKVVIAYEPIWAIGTGLTASAEQAQEMHAALRSHLASNYGQDLANEITILYGGSVKPSNADELFACPDVDGGLVGGASLKESDFGPIVKALK